MPKSFLDCIAKGGKVITKNIGRNRYLRICYLKGKSYPGEIKIKKKK